MRARFWGTRGSIATPGPGTVRFGGNTSCVAVTTDSGACFILDCGTGARESRDGEQRDCFGLDGAHDRHNLATSPWRAIRIPTPKLPPLGGSGSEPAQNCARSRLTRSKAPMYAAARPPRVWVLSAAVRRPPKTEEERA